MNQQKKPGLVVGLILALGALPAFAGAEPSPETREGEGSVLEQAVEARPRGELISRPGHSEERRGSRIMMEVAGGALGAIGGVVGTFVLFLPLAVACAGCGEGSEGGSEALFLLPGALVGMSVGVWGGGTAVDGRGGLLATLGGGLLGMGVTALVFSGGRYHAELFPLAAAAPLAGAMLGYELSGELRTAKAKRDAGMHLVPVVSVGAGGAWLGGLAGRF